MPDFFDASKIEKCIEDATRFAMQQKHEFVTAEHILHAILNDKTVNEILEGCGADPIALRKEVISFLTDPSQMPVTTVNTGFPPRQTKSLKNLIQRTVARAVTSGRSILEPSDFLVELLEDQDGTSYAVYFIRNQGVDSLKVKEFISHGDTDFGETGGMAMPGGMPGPGGPEMGEQFGDPKKLTKKNAEAVLEKFCTNLNEQAEEGLIDPLIGREDEVEAIVHTVSRRGINNPLMVGDPGVGKTAIAEGLAKRIVEKTVPEVIADATVYMLDIGALVAGTRFRGDFEERMKLVLAALEKIDGKPILFIDEIHMIMNAGSGGQGSMDVANLLKPALSKGKIRCIGSTTLDEYRKHFEKDRALVRRFQRVDIPEPSVEDSKLILRGLRKYYEEFHKIEYTDGALDAAVDLTQLYVHDKKLPDKAIVVMDSAGARQRIRPELDRKTPITNLEIEFEVSKIARIPEKSIKQGEKEQLQNLDLDLKKVVFGQDPALDTLVDAVIMGRAGLKDPTRPQGCYLFTGPTGVGKTEAAKQLADSMGVALHRFDMSEYMEKHAVARLIGSPPGYVGHEDSHGELINALDSDPRCVLLFDEIEKAHPDLVNILLQVMDHGEITNTKGKVVSARQAFIIMTSNAGAADMEKEAIGFGRTEREGDDDDAINKFFTPEFRNRLDAVVKFSKLNKPTILKVVGKFIGQLNDLAADGGVKISVTKAAKQWIADNGYNTKMGARPIARVIDKHIKRDLSREMVFGKLTEGGKVKVDLKDNKITVEVIE